MGLEICNIVSTNDITHRLEDYVYVWGCTGVINISI